MRPWQSISVMFASAALTACAGVAEKSDGAATRDPGRLYAELRQKVDDLTAVTQKPEDFVGRPLLLVGDAAGNFVPLPGRYSGLDLVDLNAKAAPIPTGEAAADHLVLVMPRDLVVQLRLREMLPPGKRSATFVECTPVLVKRGTSATYPCEIVSVMMAQDARVTKVLRRDDKGSLIYQSLVP
jgi:hypothetical protein